MAKAWVAYSGGCDSHVLLHATLAQGINCQVVHVNDHLSSNAMSMQQHCINICQELGLELKILDLKLNPKSAESIEECSRIARLEAWRDLLTDDEVLLLGHHANDQAETLLYRLIRGSSPHGMQGMQVFSKYKDLNIYRPLLRANKAEIKAYAELHQLDYVEDLMNADLRFDRNYLRHKILPLLSERWPHAVDNISRFTELNKQFMSLLAPACAEKLSNCLLQDRTLCLHKLMQEPKSWHKEIIRAWCLLHEVQITSAKLDKIISEVIYAAHDRQPQLRLKSKIIRRANNRLYIVEKQEAPDSYRVDWDMRDTLVLPNGRELRATDLAIDGRHDVVVRLGGFGFKAKKIFQRLRIPPWQRSNYPVVYRDKSLVSIVGLWHK